MATPKQRRRRRYEPSAEPPPCGRSTVAIDAQTLELACRALAAVNAKDPFSDPMTLPQWIRHCIRKSCAEALGLAAVKASRSGRRGGGAQQTLSKTG